MKAISAAILLLLCSIQAVKIESEVRQASRGRDDETHFPKNLDEETITALELSERATDEARAESIREKQQRDEEQYNKLHPKPIEQQLISSPEQLRQLEAAKEKLEQQEKDRVKQREEKMVKMKQIWSDFCVSLDKQKFTDAFMMKGELLQAGADANDMNMKVNTTDVFIKQFQFPDVAKYDYSVEQLNGLEAAEKNLNDNIDNEKLLDEFIAMAQLTAKNLEAKYGELWTAPHLPKSEQE